MIDLVPMNIIDILLDLANQLLPGVGLFRAGRFFPLEALEELEEGLLL